MKQPDYTASILVKASTDKAFHCINDIAAWWTENIEGPTKAQGDEFTIHWGTDFVTIKIVESVPEKKVVWYVTDCHLHWLADVKEWKDTQMIFVLSAEGNCTRIDFTHGGLAPQVECYEMCVKGWDQYFTDSLAKLINEGKGMPQKKAVAAAEA
ncbi:MAG: SRPBCC domain-containing protein [Bacteroidota bacterium]|nr:SRPBCC domain-containing protein [Bacteroidota bacterium]MDP4246441.1 SRPBCC domain-containing protein [Bacteroidota bacterium]MDP4254236.1 SRPBCC domain-containing protein [Bacteroidota bacterium]MDP4260073.1 SRPBCC domain-containing protein [Bacteroidota bacterium]